MTVKIRLISSFLLCLFTALLLGCDEAKSSSSTSGDEALEMFLAFDNPVGSTTAARNATQEVLALELFNPNAAKSYVVKTFELDATNITDKAGSGWLTTTGANNVNIRVKVGTNTTVLGTATAFTSNKVTITLTTQILVPARTSVRVKFEMNTTGASIQTNNNDTLALKVTTASVEITGAANPSTPLVGPPVTGNTFSFTS